MLAHPYVRWQLGRQRTWSASSAVVSAVFRGRRVGVVAVGDSTDQSSLTTTALADLRAEGFASFRVTVHPDAVADLPVRASRPDEPSYWEWMLSHSPCADPDQGVEWLDAASMAEVSDLLATHSPRAHARPGDADVVGWAGIRETGVLVAAGALVNSPAGHPHLRAISVAETHRKRGLGRDVSRFLTNAALARDSGVSLSMYSDNAAARSLYEQLGYTSQAWFASFEVAY